MLDPIVSLYFVHHQPLETLHGISRWLIPASNNPLIPAILATQTNLKFTIFVHLSIKVPMDVVPRVSVGCPVMDI